VEEANLADCSLTSRGELGRRAQTRAPKEGGVECTHQELHRTDCEGCWKDIEDLLVDNCRGKVKDAVSELMEIPMHQATVDALGMLPVVTWIHTVVNDIQSIPQRKIESNLEALYQRRCGNISTSPNNKLLVNQGDKIDMLLVINAKFLRDSRHGSE
jgi:hypothetical protein